MPFQNHVPNYAGKKWMKTSESRVFRHNSVRSKKTSNSKNVYTKSTKKQILRFYLQWCNQLLHRRLLPIYHYQNIEQKCQDTYFRLKKKTQIIIYSWQHWLKALLYLLKSWLGFNQMFHSNWRILTPFEVIPLSSIFFKMSLLGTGNVSR